MKSHLTLSALSLVIVWSLASPAFAGKVKVPTDGDLARLTVPVINQTGDFISGGLINLVGSSLVFTYDTEDSFNLDVTAPNSTGTVGFAFFGFSDFTEQPSYQLPLSGFASLLATSPDFVDNDPALTIDVAPEPNCPDSEPCAPVTFPVTITVKSSVTPPSTPEPATILPFGIGAVGLGALALRARKRQNIRTMP